MAAAVRVALGQAGGATLPNRLTPLFSFFGVASDQDPVTNPDFELAETHVYTTIPSTASALLLDSDDPFSTLGPAVPGYSSFPQTSCVISPCDTLPGASIYVFTTEIAPFPGAPPLVPLYRLRYDPDGLADCDPSIDSVPQRDYTYATTVDGVLHFKNNVIDADGVGYDLDGIEGYLFESCEGEPGCTPPTGTVRVYRMYHAERDDYAVFPETEVAAMTSQGYQEQSGLASVLGYAYLNVDSDGDALIDGFESLIGTNPAQADSDCDGLTDGAETLSYDPVLGSYGDPLIGPCGVDLIFSDGFESGDVSRWSSSVP